MFTPRRLILFKSVHHGNTATIAHALATVLHADEASPEDVPYTSLTDYSLVGFGSGVYYGRPHRAIYDWLRGLPDAAEPTTPAVVFTTSGLPFLAPLWTASLRRLLARKGFLVLGEFACRGFDTWGPLWLAGGLNRSHPDDRDLARAKAFAKKIAASVVRGKSHP